jgi:hypothetical protein
MLPNWIRLLRNRFGHRAHGSRQVPTNRRSARLALTTLEDRWVPSTSPTTPLVAASFFDSAVYEMNPSTGAVMNTLVAPNSQDTLVNPAGMTVGPDGNLYFSSQSLFNPSANSIVEYNVGNGQLSTFITPDVLNPIAAANGDSTFAPAGLTFGPDGNLYVALNGGQGASSGGAVVRFDVSNTGGVLSYSGTSTTIATGFVQPTEMTFGVSPSTLNTLYVSNSGGEIVNGNVMAIAQADGASPKTSTFIPSGLGSLNYPAGLTFGSNGNLFVVDLAATASHDGQILEYNANGTFDKVFTTPSNSLLYQFPSGMVFAPSGNLLTANLGPTYPVDFGGPGTDGSIYQFTGTGTFSSVLSGSSFPAEPVTTSNGTYLVTNFSPSQLTFNVGDVAPTVSAGNTYTINLNSSLTLHATASDASGYALTYSWSINGKDIYGQATGANPTLTWAQLAALGVTKDTSFNVQVIADDGHGQVTASAPVAVTINQIPAQLSISGAAAVNEATVYTLSLGSVKFGGASIQQWTINWGDGTANTVVSGGTKTVQHTYAAGPNYYTISATAMNSASTEAASNTVIVNVKHVAPKLTISGPASVFEESQYTLALSGVETGSHTIESWTINWGDGTTQTVEGDPSSVTHTYANGPIKYTISATATDDVSTYKASDTVAVTVKHQPPTLSISGPTTIVEGTTYTLQLSGSEVGNHIIKDWTINWGDGSALQVVKGDPSSVTHVFYARANPFTISATATDNVGTYSASGTVVVNVQHLDPILNFDGPSTAVSGKTYTLNLSGIEPLSSMHSILKWTINWGDGTTSVYTGNPTTVTHVYKNSSPQDYFISATATDNVGTYAASVTLFEPLEGGNVVSNELEVAVS